MLQHGGTRTQYSFDRSPSYLHRSRVSRMSPMSSRVPRILSTKDCTFSCARRSYDRRIVESSSAIILHCTSTSVSTERESLGRFAEGTGRSTPGWRNPSLSPARRHPSQSGFPRRSPSRTDAIHARILALCAQPATLCVRWWMRRQRFEKDPSGQTIVIQQTRNDYSEIAGGGEDAPEYP